MRDPAGGGGTVRSLRPNSTTLYRSSRRPRCCPFGQGSRGLFPRHRLSSELGRLPDPRPARPSVFGMCRFSTSIPSLTVGGGSLAKVPDDTCSASVNRLDTCPRADGGRRP